MQLWILGVVHSFCEDKLTGETVSNWSICGVFDTEQEAVSHATTEKHFVGPITLNDLRPDEPEEWNGAYYPKVFERVNKVEVDVSKPLDYHGGDADAKLSEMVRAVRECRSRQLRAAEQKLERVRECSSAIVIVAARNKDPNLSDQENVRRELAEILQINDKMLAILYDKEASDEQGTG